MSRYKAYPGYKDSGVEWLGMVPSHWTTCRIKNTATVNPAKSEVREMAPDTEVAFIPMEAIGENGELDTSRTKPLSEVISGYSYVADGDIMVAKITPCFENGKGAIARNLTNGIGFATTEVINVRPNNPKDSAYLHYLLSTNPFRKLAEGAMYGAGGQKRVADSFVAEYHFSLPEPSERTKIAAFLDHETAKIDALIEKQQRLIKLLKEKRQAVISHAVTKGLNPNAPMKDSGVEWLGEVPAHWVVCRLKQAIRSGSSISYGIVQPGEPLDNGVPFVQTTNMTKGTFNIEQLQKTSAEIAAAYPRSKLEGGEVILGIRASIGAAFVVPEELKGSNLSRGVAKIIPSDSLLSEYLVLFFQSDSVGRYWELSKQGSTFSEVSIETVREMALSIPPEQEQAEICEFVKSKLLKLELILEQAENKTSLLQERRTALISAAVTGKIDVRDWQPAAA